MSSRHGDINKTGGREVLRDGRNRPIFDVLFQRIILDI
ncbi:MAG: hypothetical protein JWN75_675 [Candidatus Saccharibacteria bacterium]|nr:hypothetical protein [Candidatus Saccharibacteria bacterium]